MPTGNRSSAPAAAAPRELIQHWPMLAVAFLVSLVSSGLRFTVGPFMVPIAADFGFSNAQLSAIVAAAALIFGLALPAAGRLADAWGSRAVVAAGTMILAASLVVVAATRSPAVFTVAYAGLASLGFAATSQVALSPIISLWFRRQRGMAMMVLSAGSMGGIAVMTPISALLTSAMGWRNTYLVMAVLTVAVLSPLVLRAIREGQPATAQAAAPADWRPALATTPFWLLAVGLFACGFSMHMLGTHGTPMLEHHGFPSMTASLGIGLIGLVSIGGTLALGALSDRVGRALFLSLIYLVRGLGFLALVAVGQEWELYLTAAIGGLVWAGSPALTSALTADIYGARVVGTLFGLLFLGHQIGAAAGAYLGGWAFDTLGDYTAAFVTAAVVLFVGAGAAWKVGTHRPGAPVMRRAQQPA